MKRYKVKVAQQVIETAEVEIVVPDETDRDGIERIAVELAGSKDDLEWDTEAVDEIYVLSVHEAEEI